MLAVVKAEPGPGLRVTHRPKPSITRDTEVLVEIAGCGLCGSDLHLLGGRIDPAARLPLIVGHESAGTVVDAGTAVAAFNPGDRVIVESSDYCGRCYYCRRGEFGFCSDHVWMGFRQDGGLAEYQVVPERCLYSIPAGLAFDEAIMVKTVGVPLHAMELVRLKPGDSVAVIGPGSIGLLAAMLAETAGATQLIVIGLERDEERLAFARARGFQVLVAEREDALARVLELTAGHGVDVVFEASGGRGTLKSAVELVRLGGQVALIGLPSEEPFNASRLINKGVTVHGSSMRSPMIWERALSLVSTRTLDVRPLLTHRFPLSRALEAFDLLKSGAGIKIIVTPG